MSNTADKLVDQVNSKVEAERVVSLLLQKFVTDAAYFRVQEEAKSIKQTPQEVWKRKINNLFRSLSTRRG